MPGAHVPAAWAEVAQVSCAWSEFFDLAPLLRPVTYTVLPPGLTAGEWPPGSRG